MDSRATEEVITDTENVRQTKEYLNDQEQVHLKVHDKDEDEEGSVKEKEKVPNVISGISIALALAYIVLRKCMLSDGEFIAICIYLILVLSYVLCCSYESDNKKSITTEEAFAEGDGDSSINSAPSDSPFGYAAVRPLRVLYEMPGKVKSKIVPELEKVAKTFRGEGVGSDNGDADDSEFVRLDKKNMYLLPEEQKEAESTNSYQNTPTPAYDSIRRKYARVDHLLCKIKHVDPELYEHVLNVQSWVGFARNRNIYN